MPKKKITKPTTRTEEDIISAKPGDYCYYLNGSNKIGFAEIKSVYEEKGILVFQVICQSEFKFLNIPAAICSFDEKDLKGKKRLILCPEVYGEQ